MNEVTDNFDWIISCVTETSIGLKLPILELYKIKRKLGFSLDIKSFIINSNNSNKLNQFLESEKLNSNNPYKTIKKLNLKILKEIYEK